LDKNGLGNTLGDFFINSSGHPGRTTKGVDSERNSGMEKVAASQSDKGTNVMIFKNIIAENFCENIGIFCSNYC
jgi:hypothetical protein